MEGQKFNRGKEELGGSNGKVSTEGGLVVQTEELSAETKAHFEDLVQRVTGGPHYSFFGGWYKVDFSQFIADWEHAQDLFQKKGLLEERRQWVEMKKGGEAFERFFDESVKVALDAYEHEMSGLHGRRVFRLLSVYPLLGYKDAAVFLGDALNHPVMRKDPDGSNQAVILDALKHLQDDRAIDAVLRHIEVVLSYDYRRESHRDSDLGDAVSTLQALAGENAKEMLKAFAEKDENFAGWFAKRKASLLADKYLTTPSKWKFEDFDPDLETARLKDLEAEYEEFRKSPPSMKVELSFGIDAFYNPFAENKQEAEPSSFVGNSQESNPASFFKSESFSLGQRAAAWEKEKLVNFYGRFRPKLERGVSVNGENYLNSLYATSVLVPPGASQEAYLNFLSGTVAENIAAGKLPESLTPSEAYCISALAFARALSLAVMDGRADEAIAELDQLKEFIGSNAEKKSEAREINFFLSLFQQLAAAQGWIASGREKLRHNAEFPKNAEALFLYHPSFKKVYEIPDFRTLLGEKIRWFLANDLFYNIPEIQLAATPEGSRIDVNGGPSFQRIRNIVDGYEESIILYRSVEKLDVPLYLESKEKLSELDLRRVVVFGRDGRYFFTALKADDFGVHDKTLRYVIITSHMLNEPQERVAKYLQQQGVTLDFAFVDTGYSGSVPEFAIRYLAKSAGTAISREELNRRIKLLCSRVQGRGELSRGGRPPYGDRESSIQIIEGRSKTIQPPSRLEMDERGRVWPSITPNSVKEQLRAWVVEHTVLRNFAPQISVEHPPVELRISPEKIRELQAIGLTPEIFLQEVSVEKGRKATSNFGERQKRFLSFISEHFSEVNAETHQELLKDAMRLYEVSRDVVGPVVADYAKWCLKKIKPDQLLLFLARDGISAWIASRLLVREGGFSGLTEGQLKYAYLSRKLVASESPERIRKYLGQFGVREDAGELVMADIGVYGMVHRALEAVYPKMRMRSLFFISHAGGPDFEGYLYDSNKQPKSEFSSVWRTIGGNPAIHFLEDTFSGFYGSANGLKKGSGGTLQPKFVAPYSSEIYLKRLAALTGIIDYVRSGGDGKNEEEHKAALNEYFEKVFPGEKEHLTVPHE